MIVSRQEMFAAVRSFQGIRPANPDEAAFYERFVLADYSAFLRTARNNTPEVNQARLEAVYAYAAQAIQLGASADRIDRIMHLLRESLIPEICSPSPFHALQTTF